MEATHSALRNDPGSGTRPLLHRSQVRSVLFQREMAPISRVVIDVVMKEAPEMALIQDHDAIQKLPSAASDPALCDAVLPGLRAAVRFGSMPIAWIVATTLCEKIEARSNTR